MTEKEARRASTRTGTHPNTSKGAAATPETCLHGKLVKSFAKINWGGDKKYFKSHPSLHHIDSAKEVVLGNWDVEMGGKQQRAAGEDRTVENDAVEVLTQETLTDVCDMVRPIRPGIDKAANEIFGTEGKQTRANGCAILVTAPEGSEGQIVHIDCRTQKNELGDKKTMVCVPLCVCLPWACALACAPA